MAAVAALIRATSTRRSPNTVCEINGRLSHLGETERMSGSFAKKLELVLKVQSMSRARLAADLGVDKSVVGAG